MMTIARGQLDHIDLFLDVGPFVVLQAGHLDFVVEVTDIADDGHVLHRAHMLDPDHVLVAGGGDEDIRAGNFVFQQRQLQTRPLPPASAQIGSTSVTFTRAPAPRRDAAEPLPTSP